MKSMVFSAWCACLAISGVTRCQEPQDVPLTTATPRLRVVEAVDHVAIVEAYVQVSGEQMAAPVTGATDPRGWFELDGFELGIPDAVDVEPAMEFVVEAHKVGFIPLRKRVRFTWTDRSIALHLHPEGAGLRTPLIDAQRGGRFQVEGLGTVVVDPGVLVHDATLMITTLPPRSWSVGLVDGIEIAQYWLEAFDAGGQSVNTALPQGASGIRLVLDLEAPVPLGAQARTWRSHCFGEVFAQDIVAEQPDNGRSVSIDLGAGHNLVEYWYTMPSNDANCSESEPWKECLVPIDSRFEPTNNLDFECGVASPGGGTITSRVEKGKTVESAWSINVELAGELGWKQLPRFEAGANVKVTGEISESTITSTLNADEKTISGGERPWDPTNPRYSGIECMRGKVRLGLRYVTYRVEMRQRKVCVGARAWNVVILGTMEVCKGLEKTLSGPDEGMPLPQWSATCPGCGPEIHWPKNVLVYPY